MSEGKPINVLNALISLGIDADSAGRVVREITKQGGQIQSRLDKINATKAQKSMELWAAAVREAGGVSKLSADQSARLSVELERLTKAGAKVPLALQPAINSMNEMRKAQDAAAKSAADRVAVQDAVTSKLGLGTGVPGLGAAAGGLLAVGAMAGAAKETYELIKASAELADQISDLSAEYQVSTDEIQTWQKIQKDTGVTVEAIGGSVTNLSKLLVNSPDKFKEWGMDVEKLRALAPEQLLGAVGEKLQGLNGQQRLAFIEDFKIANELMPHLLSGFDALREKSAGAITPLTPAELDTLKQTKDAITGIGTAWTDMWTEFGNALGSDKQVQEFLTTIKDNFIELVKVISANREELAFGAKMVAAIASGSKGGAIQATLGYMDASVRRDRMASTLAHEQGIWGDDVKVGYGVAGVAGSTGGPKVDLAARDRAMAEAKRAAEEAERIASARGAEELKVYQAFIHMLQAGAKSAEDVSRARLQAASARLVNSDLDRDVLIGPGADVKSRSGLWDAPGVIKDVQIINRELYESNKLTMSWSQFLEDAANQFQLMGASGQAIGRILGGIGGLGSLFGEGGKLSGVKGLGSLFSGGAKSVFAKLGPALQAGFAAFDIGKTIYSMFHKTEAQKVAFDVGRDYGVKISDGLAEELAKVSKSRGRDVAGLLSLDKIVGEAGGVSGFGLDKTIAKMRDLFSMIQVGKMTAEEARKPFDALFGEVAAASISKTTGLISAQAKELMAYGQSIGSESVKAFQGEQRDKAAGYLERLSKNESAGVGGDGSFLGGALGAVYARLREQGLSTSEIAEKLGPQIDALAEKFAKAGVTGGEAFAHINEKLAIFRDEATGPIASAIEDSIGLMTALYNSGDLSKQDFISGAAQVGASYAQLKEQLVAMGRDPGEALQAFGSDLQKIWEMQRRFGVEVDATTQGALDEAEAAGMIGPEFMDAQLAEQERTNDILLAGFGGLGAEMSGVADRLARAVPTDMSSYGGGSSTTTDLGRSLADALAQGGVTGGSRAPIELSGETIGAIARALASQPININTQVAIDGGAIIGAVSDQLDRNTPASQNLNNRLP